ncbi:MAG: teicoplanin resistance protein VanZ, partial [archaeon]
MAPGSGTNTRWRTVVGWSLALLIAALVPSPFDRRSSWVRFGPDKLLHFVGYGGYAVALARAIDGDHDDTLVAAMLSVGLSSLYSLVVGNLQENVPGRKNE